MKYSKGHFREIQKSLKEAATRVIMGSSSVSEMRGVAKLAEIKINYVKYLSKEYALMIKKNKIVVTGGNGRFAQSLKKIKSKYNFVYPSKNKLDITYTNSIIRFLKKTKPKSVLHLAGLSRPMIDHEKKITKSINLNITNRQKESKEILRRKKKEIIFNW